MSERRTDWRPFLLFALGPLGWLVMAIWAVYSFVGGFVAGLTGRLDDDDDDDDDGPPRRRYRQA